jgi:lysophospholipase L1-like esterase
MPRDASGWGSRCVALLLGLGLALAAGELLLRGLRPPQLSLIRYPCIYTPDPELGFRYQPHASGVVAGHFEFENEVATNSLGFYDDEPLPSHRARPRILAVGDSFTAAMNVPKVQVWTSVLERALRERGFPDADVVNAGLDGTGTDVHVALIREYAERLRPDVTLLAFFANDLGDVLSGRFSRECYRGFVLSYPDELHRDRLRARVDAHESRPLRRWLYRNSYLARLVAGFFLPPLNPYRAEFLQPRRAELPSGPQVEAAGRLRWNAALAGLRELAQTCDCGLRVVPVPPRSEARGSLETWQRAAGPSGLDVLDLLPALEARRRASGSLAHEDLYFRHDNHFNATGNEIFGLALADVLVAELRSAGPAPPAGLEPAAR